MEQVIKLKRRGFTLLLVFILLTSFTSNAFGDKLNTKLKKQKTAQIKTKANYQAVLDKIDTIESNIEQLDNDIEDKLQLISETNVKITKTKGDVKIAQKAIDSTTSSINSEQAAYDERLRAMYMNGPTGYLELILDSKSIIDFLERYELAKSIMRFDTNLINSLENKKKTKVLQKAILVEKQNSLVALQNKNKSQLAQLNATKTKQNNLIAYLKAQEKKYKKAIDAQNALIAATLKQIAALARLQGQHPSGKYSSDALVVYAAKFLGTRYVWGGTTPSGFDCSGFTKYVYAHFGISLNRVSRDQANQGTRVTKQGLKPGDLVFFGNPIHHVGIYVGNNSFIHAPRTGDVVRISPLTRSDFRFGVRLK
jgi:peptidoglycan DL-endopeptidase CwlO